MDIGKKRWPDRRAWCDGKSDLIEATAKLNDERWLKAKEPFMFMACCIELVAARDPNHKTHLPIAFDGASNVLVHFSALSRSDPLGIMGGCEPATANPVPDPYGGDMIVRLEVATGHQFSRDDAKPFGQRMHYGLSDYGIAQQLEEALKAQGAKLPSDWSERGKYIYEMGKKVRKAIEDMHPGAKKIMGFLRDLQRYTAEYDEPLQCEMSSGWPWLNLYNKTKTERIRALLDGIEIRPKVADGYLPEIRRGKSNSAVVANYIHGRDAAHMARTVNACVSAGIRDKMAIHDCHACLLPQAAELNRIIRDQFVLMHGGNVNPLAELRDRALQVTAALRKKGKRVAKATGVDTPELKLPEQGDLDLEARFPNSTYAYSP